ncbi:hypothetical protein BGZ60DRAFT_563781 [Tricladium varicosporioides]|nr:hypothetical protein BGZ60DRAFT_563781 [Hymenoscyphus varicosporioides]
MCLNGEGRDDPHTVDKRTVVPAPEIYQLQHGQASVQGATTSPLWQGSWTGLQQSPEDNYHPAESPEALSGNLLSLRSQLIKLQVCQCGELSSSLKETDEILAAFLINSQPSILFFYDCACVVPEKLSEEPLATGPLSTQTQGLQVTDWIDYAVAGCLKVTKFTPTSEIQRIQHRARREQVAIWCKN